MDPQHGQSNTDRPILLIVDDQPENLAVLAEILGDDYQVRAARSGAQALRIAASLPRPDLALLDIMMPGMDGFAVLAHLREDPVTRDIPVIFVTALDDTRTEVLGFTAGAVDYIGKPFVPAVVQARVRTHLELKLARDRLSDQNAWLEQEVNRRMEENAMIQEVSIRALAHLAEIRDLETGNHILRTQGYMRELAESLRDHPRFSAVLTPHFIEVLVRSAPLHDIGKIGIPDQILCKPGPLTPAEWTVMKTHAALGADAIAWAERSLPRPLEFLALAREIARWHHERWDGHGYPDGLAGEQIPLAARLMALADVFDALVSERIYKRPMPFAAAREIISAGRGSHFDPDVVDAFLAQFDTFAAIARRHQDTHGPASASPAQPPMDAQGVPTP
ncbi:two-component system response regulator [uncultured Thiodictyon sp.]|uniref:HD-GYP domain-containing protein n=1 Tax=uncultured Thiodictyon sp. TaxID=1846217 RepID=UPI0025F4BB6F|nr:two-component system response regulator [uncultured Thiodictyon sp.]